MNIEQQAFPDDVNYGMTLRDYFAAKSVTWFLTKLDDEGVVDDHDLLRQFAAEHSYKLADAMMKARTK
jgi:hypothetical protein